MTLNMEKGLLDTKMENKLNCYGIKDRRLRNYILVKVKSSNHELEKLVKNMILKISMNN